MALASSVLAPESLQILTSSGLTSTVSSVNSSRFSRFPAFSVAFCSVVILLVIPPGSDYEILLLRTPDSGVSISDKDRSAHIYPIFVLHDLSESSYNPALAFSSQSVLHKPYRHGVSFVLSDNFNGSGEVRLSLAALWIVKSYNE